VDVQGTEPWRHAYRPSDAQLALLNRAVDSNDAHSGPVGVPNSLVPPSLPGNYSQQVCSPATCPLASFFSHVWNTDPSSLALGR